MVEASAGGGGGSSAVPAPPQKSREELEEAAEMIRKAAQSGTQKQMKVDVYDYVPLATADGHVAATQWRPSCKTNSAKWSYDGICADPQVFGVLMGLEGPPTFKMKKIPKNEFEDLIGSCRGHARCALYCRCLRAVF